LTPSYSQNPVDLESAEAGFVLMASRDGRDGSIQVHQDMDLHLARPDGTSAARLALRTGRHAYVHVARGKARLKDVDLDEGDGVALSGESELSLTGRGRAEVLVFDLA